MKRGAYGCSTRPSSRIRTLSALDRLRRRADADSFTSIGGECVRESERSLVAMFGGCVGRVRGVMVSTELRNGRFVT